jgi:hypothetical protein
MISTMAMHPSSHGSPGELDRDIELRDRLTVERLCEAVADLPAVEIVGFDARWWDGQAYGPCLVVRDPATGRRRVLETGGDAVVLPFSRRKASRALARQRHPKPIELLGAPSPRTPVDDLVLDAEHDATCRACRRCAAMRVVGSTGPCPICGDASI